MTAPPSPVAAPGRTVTVALTSLDRLRPLTIGALVIAAAAPVFAAAGIPPVPLMWPLYRLGVVLPSCGLTRGVVALARGDLAAAMEWNPASPLAAVAAAIGLLRAAVGAATGRWLHVLVQPRWWLLVVATVAVALLWVNQWNHAGQLMSRR